MPIFKIEGNALQPVAPATFGAAHGEDRLETILHSSGDELGVCFIARQPHTDHGKRPDLIGIAADGAVEVWELKRGRAPRDIVAQALECAAWAAGLNREALEQLAAQNNTTDKPLADRLREVFGAGSATWTPPALNTRQRVVLVAEEFDPQTLDVCRWLALQGVGIYCWSFVYHTGRGGEEFLAVERLTWSARGDEAAPGARAEAPKRTRSRAEMLAALDSLLKGETVARLVADGRLEGGRPLYLYAGKCFIAEVWVEGAGPVGLHFWVEPSDPPRGPDVFWFGRQWNRRRTAPRVEALLQPSNGLITALESTFGPVECQPTGHGGYPKWIVRGHVGDAAHAYEPAWIVANVEAALRAVAAAVPFTARSVTSA